MAKTKTYTEADFARYRAEFYAALNEVVPQNASALMDAVEQEMNRAVGEPQNLEDVRNLSAAEQIEHREAVDRILSGKPSPQESGEPMTRDDVLALSPEDQIKYRNEVNEILEMGGAA